MNFGSVLNAGRITPSLLKRLLGEFDLSRVKAVQWGVQNEAEAINHFRKCTGLPVAETGIWLDPNGVLGASPDGLIGPAGAMLHVALNSSNTTDSTYSLVSMLCSIGL